MKKALTGFKKMAGWLQAVIVIVIVAALVLVGLIIYNIYKSIKNGAKGLTDILGLTESKGAKAAKDDAAAAVWTDQLAVKYPSEITLTKTVLTQMAVDIYDSWGFFADNFEKTFATIKKCHNKVDVSALVKAFYDKYTEDLLGFIVPGTWHLEFRNRMSDAQFEMVHNFVNSLPND